jgi:hypothetical protein
MQQRWEYLASRWLAAALARKTEQKHFYSLESN